MPRPRLARNVIALGFVSLLTDAGTEIVYPLLPLFLTTLGATPLFIGLVEGTAEATASLLKVVTGWVSDRLGKRKALVLTGYGISSATRPLMALAFWPWHVLAVRFLDRVGKGIRTAPRDALLAASTDARIRGRAFGFHRAMDHAGAVVGPLIAFVLLNTLLADPEQASAATYRLVFWAAVLPAVLAVGTLLIFVREIPTPRTATQAPLRLSLAPFDTSFRRFLAVVVLFTLGNSSDAFLLLRASQTGIHVAYIPILWAVLHLVKSVSSVPGGAWSDRVGRKKALALGWMVYALIYAGFGFANAAWQMWTLFALYGLYFGLTEGAEKAFIADLVAGHARATAYGLHGFAVGIVALPSSLLMGLLWTAYSPQVAFLFGSGLALTAVALLGSVRVGSTNA